MSHYQHNINGTQFPAGTHVAHYSLANTTLIGQEVQRRLWEKYWGEQFPAQPPPHMWFQPGVCHHSYPCGIPPTFHPVYAQTNSNQSKHPVLLPTARQEYRSDTPDKTLRANSDNGAARACGENKNLPTNTKTSSKQTQVLNSVSHKVLDPVTDDLNWSIFSSDLADGIAVSILDSFISELPVLDITMVQSVLQDIEKHLPQDEAQKQNCSIKKLDYFSETESLPGIQQSSSNEISSKEEGGSSEKTGNSNALERCKTLSETGSFSNIFREESAGSSSLGFHTIGKTFQEEDICSEVVVVNPDTSHTNETSATDSSSTDGHLMELVAYDNNLKEEQRNSFSIIPSKSSSS